ncbi:ATP-binding protein [Fulvivirgaceae bacterium BMA10]|uniref:ATP-binding protein n=1 Tax=Splendidivirga corallicola TaxID=3051826 RepID=A0ABT8KGI5_9BACT|nr:ATP-binding protein [Fulvivirgaceae bacterium BMA10]
MPKERIYIENFAGIKKLEMDFSDVNLIIGPQASGKSVTVKLLYFFKSFFNEILIEILNGKSKSDIDKGQKEKFIRYFPRESWPRSSFEIEYSINDSFLKVSKLPSAKNIVFTYSESVEGLIKDSQNYVKARPEESMKGFISEVVYSNELDDLIEQKISNQGLFDQLFVPAGRSFFSSFQSTIFSIIKQNIPLDPFLIEFGSYYENVRGRKIQKSKQKRNQGFYELVDEILCGEYIREKGKDFLFHNDERKVNLSHASSGQQEILPLLLVLNSFINNPTLGNGITLYIEEPEAHLFPIAQKRIVQLLARIINEGNCKFQIIVTTHSPYILTAFNNLVQAGKLKASKEISNDQLFKIIPEKEIINPNLVRAYSMKNGRKENIIDNENQLISQNILDSVSNEIAKEFGDLLDLEF